MGLHEALSHAIEEKTGARARLRAFVDAFLHFYETHPDEYRLVYVTQHAAHKSEQVGVDQANIYTDLTCLVRRTMSDFAAELGADPTHLKIAEDLAVVAKFGYLQAAMLNQRYPWSERATLRSACMSQVLLMVERCLLYGADGVDAGHLDS